MRKGKMLVAAHGSRGDITPMLRLSASLNARGHKVTFCSTPANSVLAAEWGFRTVSAGPEFGRENVEKVFDKMRENRFRPIAALITFGEATFKPYIVPGFNAVAQLAPEHDVLIWNIAATWTRAVVQKLRKPSVQVHVTTLSFPSDT